MKSIFWNGEIAFLLFSKNRPFSIKQFFHNRKCMNTWNILHFSLLLNYCLSLDEYCEYWLGRTKYIYTATAYFIVETNVYYLTDSLERKQYNVSAKHLLVFFSVSSINLFIIVVVMLISHLLYTIEKNYYCLFVVYSCWELSKEYRGRYRVRRRMVCVNVCTVIIIIVKLAGAAVVIIKSQITFTWEIGSFFCVVSGDDDGGGGEGAEEGTIRAEM